MHGMAVDLVGCMSKEVKTSLLRVCMSEET